MRSTKGYIDKIFRHLVRSRPSRCFGEESDPYLRRYYLCGLPFGWTLHLHHWMSSEEDVDLHCHGWNGVSVILVGGYVEYSCMDSDPTLRKRNFWPGSVNLVNTRQWHYIRLRKQSAWTLFAHGSPHIQASKLGETEHFSDPTAYRWWKT